MYNISFLSHVERSHSNQKPSQVSCKLNQIFTLLCNQKC